MLRVVDAEDGESFFGVIKNVGGLQRELSRLGESFPVLRDLVGIQAGVEPERGDLALFRGLETGDLLLVEFAQAFFRDFLLRLEHWPQFRFPQPGSQEPADLVPDGGIVGEAGVEGGLGEAGPLDEVVEGVLAGLFIVAAVVALPQVVGEVGFGDDDGADAEEFALARSLDGDLSFLRGLFLAANQGEQDGEGGQGTGDEGMSLHVGPMAA